MGLGNKGMDNVHCKWGIPGMLIGDEELDFSRIESAKAAYGAAKAKPASGSAKSAKDGAFGADAVSLFARTPLKGVGLPTRMANLAERMGLETVEDLIRNLSEVEGERTVGTGTVAGTRRVLDSSALAAGNLYSKDALKALATAFGNNEYAFGFCGELVKVPADSEAPSIQLSNRLHDIELTDNGVLDQPVTALGLPAHLSGRVVAHGFRTVGDVLQAGEEGLLDIRHVGAGKASEVMAAVWSFLSPLAKAPDEKPETAESMTPDTMIIESVPFEAPFAEALIALLASGYPVRIPALKVCAKSWAIEGEALTAESIVAKVEGSSALARACETILHERVLSLAKEAKAGHWPNPIAVGPGQVWATAARRSVEMVKGFAFDEDRRQIVLSPLALDEWIASLPDNKSSMLKMRLAGMSFAEVSERKGLSKQRVQQVIAKAFADKPVLAEDRYAPLYKRYAFKLSEFSDATGEPAATYRYLEVMHGRPGVKPIAKCLGDDGVPASVKVGVSALVDKGFVIVGSERIHRDRDSVLEHLVKKHATDTYVSHQELRRLYVSFMDSNGMGHLLGKSGASDNSFKGYLQRQSYLLFAPAGQLRGDVRAYDLEGRDFTELKRFVIGIGYENVEISAALIFERKDAAEIMASYDVRDAYELYSLLKTAFEGDGRVTFERSPHLCFGLADRKRQMLDLLAEVGPVDADAFATAYRERYGVREDSFKGTFLKLVASCRRNGLYSAQRSELTDEQRAFIVGELSDDLVSVELVRSRFRAAFPGAPAALTGPDAASEFGYSLDRGLLVRDGVDLERVLVKRIASRPLFKMGDPGFDRAVFESDAFKAELFKAQRALEILECSPGEYASVASLAALDKPVSKEELRDYVEKAVEFMKADVPYTVSRLRAEGFAHSLDRLEHELGMGDWLFASLICLACVGGRIKKSTWKGETFFWRGIRPLSMPVIVESVMGETQCCRVDELCEMLEEQLGVECSEYEMRTVLRRTDLLYKEDLEMVFADETAYERKVREWI